MSIPFLQQPLDVLLDTLSSELHQQWRFFNRELKQGQLKHLEYDRDTKKLHWRRPKADNRKPQEQTFYSQLPFCDIADVLRFVNKQCHFLSALKPLQPRLTVSVMRLRHCRSSRIIRLILTSCTVLSMGRNSVLSIRP